MDVSEACEVLAGWDGRMDVDSRGALLFDRYWQRVDAATGGDETALWLVPFSPEDPVHTPNTLADGPVVSTALADAVSELESAAIPLDAALGDHQYVERNGKRIPLGGGGGGERGVLGVFNLVDLTFSPEHGYTDPVTGSGYLHVVQFDGTPCPDAVTLLTYSQSSEPSSPHYADQTALYSRKGWVRDRFCERDILASPAFESEFVLNDD